MRKALVCLAVLAATAVPRAQESVAEAARRKTFDQILDLYVRDGMVYYRALKLERAKLDGFVNLIAATNPDKLSREERLAFWLNAYNALVLRTVIDHYPIPTRSSAYPPRSIRQIPGAFERLPHKVGGRTLTLDQIEQAVLPEFQDPRVYLALGRGAVGSGRLRSEAYTPELVQKQLTEVAEECLSRPTCVQIDRDSGRIDVNSVFSWREKEFSAAYADKAPPAFSDRSPIERAIVAFIQPKLLTIEREFLAKNTFQVTYKPFDWSLNDLTGRGGR
jgi:type II secretory pathway pseudopilin PulG